MAYKTTRHNSALYHLNKKTSFFVYRYIAGIQHIFIVRAYESIPVEVKCWLGFTPCHPARADYSISGHIRTFITNEIFAYRTNISDKITLYLSRILHNT